ncbi:MAG: extracellular catalytic domain type 1 short-chain-length polyhydroxyalkanoate depolymerase [Acidimicrobiia bacterium]
MWSGDRRWIGLAAAALLLGGCADVLVAAPPSSTMTSAAPPPTTTTTAPAATLTVPAPLPPNVDEVALDVAGVTRSYLLFVPESLHPDDPVPLVIDLHGFTVDAVRHGSVSRWNALAGIEGFVVATPSALGDPLSWAIASGTASTADIAFLLAVIDDVAAQVTIDPGRVYLSGFSNGGGMAHRLACEHAERVAAIGTVAGAYVDADDCAPSRPVSVIAFHGTSDLVVPYDGLSDVFPPILDWAHAWAGRDRCAPVAARTEVSADTVADTWTGCAGGTGVVVYTVESGSHAWPGADHTGLFVPTDTIDATALMWAFFRDHGH